MFQDGAHNSYGGASGGAGSEVLRGQLYLLSSAAIHNFYHINRSECLFYFFNIKLFVMWIVINLKTGRLKKNYSHIYNKQRPVS